MGALESIPLVEHILDQFFVFRDEDDENSGPRRDDDLEFGNFQFQPEFEDRKRNEKFDNSTLFDLTAQSIFANQNHFLGVFELTGINPFDQISKIMRVELIEKSSLITRSSWYTEEDCKLLILLMNDKLSSVAFLKLPFADKHKMKNVTDSWFAMTNKCPNLQELVCEARNPYLFKAEIDASNKVVLFSLMLLFKELQVLEIPDIVCDNFRLELLAESLPKLRVLSVDLGPKASSSGIATLAKLEDLQEFLFTCDCRLLNRRTDRKRLFQFYKACLLLLPWLKISGSRKEFELIVYNFPSSFHGNAFRELKKRLPKQLGLRQLVLYRASGMPVGVALPNLESLYLVQPGVNFRLCSGLSLLEELVLLDIEQLALKRILGSVGRQLRRLTIAATDVLNLDIVFRMCPRLQKLYIPRCPKQIFGLTEPLEVTSGITELGLMQAFSKHGTISALSTEDVLQILQACLNVRVLHLDNAVFTEEGGMEICRALEERSILQHLVQFFFNYDWPDWMMMPGEDLETTRIKRNCFSVLQCMNHFCPKLTTFQLQNF